MRPFDVQSLFVRRFGDLYPQLKFRAMRHAPANGQAAQGLILRVSLGRANVELDLHCEILGDGQLEGVQSWLERPQASSPAPLVGDASDMANGAVGAGAALGVHPLSVVVAPDLSYDAQRLLQNRGIGYLDLSGNAYLETHGVYVQIDGRASRVAAEREHRSPFMGKGERVVRRLLLQPKKPWTMRQLAQAAHVSLGLASNVTSALAELGVVTKDRSGVEVFDPGRLLDAWAESYELQRSTLATYRSSLSAADLQRILIRERANLRHHYALTLWSAVQVRLPTVVLKSSHLAFYWLHGIDEVSDVLQLSKDKGQTYVFCFQPYDESLLWGMEAARGLYVVHPLQIFLDLSRGDAGEVQLAQRVRETLLGW